MTMAHAQDVTAGKHPEALPRSSCQVAVTSDSNNQPVYFWQHAFADGVQDLAMAKMRPGEALDIKRVTFGGSANPDCHYEALAIVRSHGSDWGWHLAWLAKGSSILRYARMDGEAWVSSPVKKLSMHAHPAAAPQILASGQQVWIVWYEAGTVNSIYAVFSDDEGRTWHDAELIAQTDKPLVELQLKMKERIPYLEGQGIADGVPLPQ